MNEGPQPADPFSITWSAFRDRFFPDDPDRDVPLFLSGEGDGLKVIQVGARRVLAHAGAVDRLLARELDKLRQGLNDSAWRGLIYILYTRGAGGCFEPLYVGLAEKLGRSGKLSGPLASSKRPASRFGYDPQGHVGGISDALFGVGKGAYSRWPERIFELPLDESRPRLKRRLFVWAKAWRSDLPIEIGESVFPGCSLGFLEALLIYTLDALYPGQLLNAKGKDRTAI